MNSYSYARNNPIILTDPTGEITREIKDYLLATLYFTVQVVSAMVWIELVGDPSESKSNSQEALNMWNKGALAIGVVSIVGWAAGILAKWWASEGAASLGKATEAWEGGWTTSSVKITKPKYWSKWWPWEGKAFSKNVKDAAYKEAEGKCVFCKEKTQQKWPSWPKKAETDHSIPKSKWWNNTLNNAQNTCRTCNRQKGAQSTTDYLKTKKK